MVNNSEINYPPPWNLNGTGFIFPFSISKEFNIQNGFIEKEDESNFQGGLGYCMFVNYETSPVGPYFELLYIPGIFKYKDKSYRKITKIYVSNELSIREGRKNWAIPKEFAKFTWTKDKNNTYIDIENSNGTFFSIDITNYLIPFPIHTSIYPVKLLQRQIDNTILKTQFIGKGWAKISSVKKIKISSNSFPDISDSIKFGLEVNPFYLTFPVAEII